MLMSFGHGDPPDGPSTDHDTLSGQQLRFLLCLFSMGPSSKHEQICISLIIFFSLKTDIRYSTIRFLLRLYMYFSDVLQVTQYIVSVKSSYPIHHGS